MRKIMIKKKLKFCNLNNTHTSGKRNILIKSCSTITIYVQHFLKRVFMDIYRKKLFLQSFFRVFLRCNFILFWISKDT